MKDSTRRTIRTAVAVGVALVVIAPVLVQDIGVDQTVGVGATVVGVSAGLTRLLVTLEPVLPAWLKKELPPVQ